MSNLKQKRLEDYQATQLFPINFFQENSKKKLLASLNLFKICKNFPREEIGTMKNLQKEQEKNLVSQMYFGKDFSDLSNEERIQAKQILSKRASTPTRVSPYVKFLIKSIFISLGQEVKFSSYMEEIEQGWVVDCCGRKMDITVNPNKGGDNLIYVDASCVFENDGMLKKNCISALCKELPVSLDFGRVEELNYLMNQQIMKFEKIYQSQDRSNLFKAGNVQKREEH